MNIELKVYDNGDHAVLVWFPEDGKRIPDCRGFTIKRKHNGKEDYLRSFVGFAEGEQPPSDAQEFWKWPLQRYLWWDYYVQPGDKVQYQVIAVTGKDKGHLALSKIASEQTEEITISPQCTEHMSAYFNKGVLASQWVSRILDEKMQQSGKGRQVTATEFLQKPGDNLRDALGGLLKADILHLLDEAKQSGGKVFAALYELEDQELQQRLEDLGPQVNLILANGAFNTRKPDENSEVRRWLRENTKVNMFDRMVSAGHFAHNKFVVLCDPQGKARKVLTGSTNWTWRGLCAQVNNGLVINDAAVADAFLQQWERLHSAGNGFPEELVSADSQLKQFEVDQVKVTTWFAPTAHTEDLAYARRLINQAQEGILFLFFDPGTFQDDPNHWTLLQSVLNRHHSGNNPYYNPNLYLRGVVNQEIPELTEDPSVAPSQARPPRRLGHQPSDAELDAAAATHPVSLYSDGNSAPQRLTHDVLVPSAIKEKLGSWEDELLKVGVMVHSKVIVIDPFGAKPVLMTGSHNLGFKASSKNDDNLVIIEGAGSLAAAYAANIIGVYQNYRWNCYVEQHRRDPKMWHGLEDNDTWQDGYLSGDQEAEIKFWLGEAPAAQAVETGAPAPGEGGTPGVHHATPQHRRGSAAARSGGASAARKRSGTPSHPAKHVHVGKKT